MGHVTEKKTAYGGGGGGGVLGLSKKGGSTLLILVSHTHFHCSLLKKKVFRVFGIIEEPPRYPCMLYTSELAGDNSTVLIYSLVLRPSSTLTFGGPGMPNQMFEWVGPRQRYCTQCHYDKFLETPTATYSLLEKSGAAAIIGELLPGSGSPDSGSCC